MNDLLFLGLSVGIYVLCIFCLCLSSSIGGKMSEIAKCPVCGKDFKKSILRQEYEGCVGSLATVKCCGMEAVTVELWNRYAAAMELAKAEVAASNVVWSVPLERLEPAVEAGEDLLFQAKMRVLEVFGK